MCSKFFSQKEIAYKYILDYLNMLIYDKVVNVRITFAKVLSKLIRKKSKLSFNTNLEYEWMLTDKYVMTFAGLLKGDTNKNVNIYFQDLNDIEPIKSEAIGQYNSKFIENMIFLKDEFGAYKNLPLEYKVNFKVEENKSLVQTTPNILVNNITDTTDIINNNTEDKTMQNTENMIKTEDEHTNDIENQDEKVDGVTNENNSTLMNDEDNVNNENENIEKND